MIVGAPGILSPSIVVYGSVIGAVQILSAGIDVVVFNEKNTVGSLVDLYASKPPHADNANIVDNIIRD